MSLATPREMAATLLDADSYLDVFPTSVKLKDDYRLIARLVHPDLCAPEIRDLATRAFQRLNQLHSDAEKMMAEGRFGEKVVLATIRTRRAVHTITRRLDWPGDLTNLYETSTVHDDPRPTATVLKVARSAKDNDLIAAEATALKRLHGVDDNLTRAYPKLLDSFMHPEGRRRANALVRVDGYTAAQLGESFPDGLDPRHVVWIWRKLLMALGFAHDQGIIHGAVVPRHVLILPEVHGVMLMDWCYSSIDNGGYPPIKAMVPGCTSWYPEEVLNKKTPSPATDIMMAARVIQGLNSDLPKPLRAFFKGCVLTKQSMRPQDSWVLLKEFDDLLEGMGVPYYPRRFVELTVPTGAAS